MVRKACEYLERKCRASGARLRQQAGRGVDSSLFYAHGERSEFDVAEDTLLCITLHIIFN